MFILFAFVNHERKCASAQLSLLLTSGSGHRQDNARVVRIVAAILFLVTSPEAKYTGTVKFLVKLFL